MSEEAVTKHRPAASITNLTVPRVRDPCKSKLSKIMAPELAESKTNHGIQPAVHASKLDADRAIHPIFSSASALPSTHMHDPKTFRQFRANLPWLDGKPPSVNSERMISSPRMPGAFESESLISLSEQSSKDVDVHAKGLKSSIPKLESSISKGNTQSRPSLPWIRRPGASSPALSSANISPTTPMALNRQKTEVYLNDESVKDESSLSSDATSGVMTVPIDVRSLGNHATNSTTRKVEPLGLSGSSSTISSSRTSVAGSYDHMRNNLANVTDVDNQSRQLAASLNYPTKEEPVKIIDFVEGANEGLRKASDAKAPRALAYIDPMPISDASSLSSSLAYDLTSVASVDVEMEGSSCQSAYHHRPNFSTRDILKSPDIRIGESARSFRRKSGIGNSDPMPRGKVASQPPFLQGQSAKRVSFHPNMPLHGEPIKHHNLENQQFSQCTLLGMSDVRRRHGKQNTIQVPLRNSSIKNLDAAQKDAAADSSAHRYGEAPEGMGQVDLGLRHTDEGGYDHRNEEMAGISIHQKNPNRKETGFSFRRYKHRPVARNWKNQRKRVVALVACFNTGLIGYIVGIYVS